MNVFCCYFYSFILYRDFFSIKSRFAPICFLFHHHNCGSIFVSSILLSNLLTKWQKSWAFLLHDSSFSSSSKTYSFPSHSQSWPKGDPCCTDTLFLSKNLNASPLALHETGHVYRAEPGSRSHNPLNSFGHISCIQTSLWTKRGSVVWMYCYCFHSVWGVGVERVGGGKWRISYWSSARRMGVLYNVELVSCVLWCKDDGNELLFLFYDLSVSVKWITAIYSESNFVCIIVTFAEQKQ